MFPEDLLVDFMSKSSGSGSASSFFGRYVEDTLTKLPGDIRRTAEMNIMSELHRAQSAAEQRTTTAYQQPYRQPAMQQPQQPQFQQSQPQHQFEESQWQPQPSQWPAEPVGPHTSVWGSMDARYVQRQVPTHAISCPATSIFSSVSCVAAATSSLSSYNTSRTTSSTTKVTTSFVDESLTTIVNTLFSASTPVASTLALVNAEQHLGE